MSELPEIFEGNYLLTPKQKDYIQALETEREKGLYQMCPVCDGTRYAMNHSNEIPYVHDQCHRCEGTGTIERPDSELQKLKEYPIDHKYKCNLNRGFFRAGEKCTCGLDELLNQSHE